MRLGGQTASGVRQHHINFACLGSLYRVKNNRGGIAALLRNHRYIVACAPFHQLFTRCGAEGVACCQQHRLALSLKIFCQLADGGGFARAVHANQHNDEGLVIADIQRYGEGLQ